MALTDPEKQIVVFIFNRDLVPMGPFAIADFFDQPKATQMLQLKNRVQLIRDAIQAKITAHNTEAAARLASLQAELAVLDGLIVKLT